MLADLEAFLVQSTPMAQESVVWGGSQLAFRVTSYLGLDLPPLDSVTSVRCLVCRDDSVLVIRDPDPPAIAPAPSPAPSNPRPWSLTDPARASPAIRVREGGLCAFVAVISIARLAQ